MATDRDAYILGFLEAKAVSDPGLAEHIRTASLAADAKYPEYRSWSQTRERIAKMRDDLGGET